MTKQEAIDNAWTLLEILEAMPDGVDILRVQAAGYNFPASLQIQLNSGIEAVAKSVGCHISAHTSRESEYTHRKINTANCEYVQLDDVDKEAAPSDDSTGDGRA